MGSAEGQIPSQLYLAVLGCRCPAKSALVLSQHRASWSIERQGLTFVANMPLPATGAGTSSELGSFWVPATCQQCTAGTPGRSSAPKRPSPWGDWQDSEPLHWLVIKPTLLSLPLFHFYLLFGNILGRACSHFSPVSPGVG